MTPLIVIGLLVWAAIILVWAGLLVAQWAARRDGLLLDPLPADVPLPDPPPSVCVVIPARNEADTLEACLRHVLSQDYPALSVLIVDDRSEDATPQVAAAIAARDPRVRFLRVESLPEGWMGKSHALWQATREAAADWLLFIDVDCTLAPGAVRTAVIEATRRDAELLTLWPRQADGGFWEHVAIPLCAAIIALWFGSRRREPFANGAFLMMRRDAYERVGGHHAVRSALIEDVPFAEHAAASGVRWWVASGRHVVSVRMYDSYRELVDGWARIYVGALRGGTRIAASIVWLLAGSLWPYVAALALLAGFLAGYRPDGASQRLVWIVAGMCAAHFALMLAASYRFWGLGGCRRRYLVLYPLSVLVVIRILGRAWWWLIIKRRVPWRNRSYAIDRSGMIVG